MLYSVLSYNAELASSHKILEKCCTKIRSKSTAGFLVAPRSLADSVHEGTNQTYLKIGSMWLTKYASAVPKNWVDVANKICFDRA